MDFYEANRKAWNSEGENNNYWTQIVEEKAIEKAKSGNVEIWITPFKAVPLSWLEGLKGKNVLLGCAGGGQQTPLLAAYGCIVTTIDLSDFQIQQDKRALEKYNLKAKLINGNIMDMDFEDESFDAVIIPQALNFIEDLKTLYKKVNKVLKPNGLFLFGISNPGLYMLDDKIQERKLKIKYTLPFSDTKSLSKKELQKRLNKNDTVEFSHTLQDIIGGLTESGFVISGYYSDQCGSELTDSFFYDSHMAFKANKV